MIRKSYLYTVCFLVALFLLSGCSADKSDYLVDLSGRTMGTSYSVKIVDKTLSENDSYQNDLQNEIDDLLKEVNRQMSTWQEDSEISQFNKYDKTEWFNVSEDFVKVIEESQKISRKTEGALDITLGPLINLWGFGSGSDEYKIPSQKLLDSAKLLTGYEKVSTDKSKLAVRKENGKTYISLAAIAKGFGVDRIWDLLDKKEFSNYLIEIGGEVRSKGKNHLNDSWKIGISVPDGSFDIQKIIELKDLAVATSGDYRNYFEKDGVRYSHTIDPRTGKPITHELASVTVVHENCTAADGFATAVNVLGPEKGYQIAEKEKLAALLIVKAENGFKEILTPQFEVLLNRN